jgi:beta-phosphoglucomutase-like phosphatase (HAD superfamily)
LKAIIFDVDGTLSETEETHRKAFNQAFKERGVTWNWDRTLYRELLRVTGGKERIRHFIEHYDASGSETVDSDEQIRALHLEKTDIYTRMVAAGEATLRPGIRQAISTAQQNGYRLAISTTTSLPNIDALLQSAYGSEGSNIFEVICAGDMVKEKKPAPDIYLLTLEMLGLPPEDCIAIEDTRNGLLSAHRAGIATVITPSFYSDDQCFDEALLITDDIGSVDFEALFSRLRK